MRSGHLLLTNIVSSHIPFFIIIVSKFCQSIANNNTAHAER